MLSRDYVFGGVGVASVAGGVRKGSTVGTPAGWK